MIPADTVKRLRRITRYDLNPIGIVVVLMCKECNQPLEAAAGSSQCECFRWETR